MIKLSQDIIIKQLPEDFLVKEVPHLPIELSTYKKQDCITILWVTKKGLTTFEVIDFLCFKLALDNRDVHCEGLKDEDGITEQVMSITKILSKSDIELINVKENHKSKTYISISILGYAKTHVNEKNLHGNVFSVNLRNLNTEVVNQIYTKNQKPAEMAFLNYYDQQRFGLPGGPFLTHLIGKSIIQNRWDVAEEYYSKSGNQKIDQKNTKDKPTLKSINPAKLQFFLGAYDSYIWNNQLSEMIGSKQRLEIFSSHEVNTFNKLINQSIPLLLKSKGHSIDSNYQINTIEKSRASIVFTTIFIEQPVTDTLNIDRYSIRVHFFLPKGSYATMIIKQYLKLIV
jgi:tRNA pseudouridine13 synthase